MRIDKGRTPLRFITGAQGRLFTDKRLRRFFFLKNDFVVDYGETSGTSDYWSVHFASFQSGEAAPPGRVFLKVAINRS